MVWDPEVYESFARERERPLLDLLARVPDLGFSAIVDAGCGTGRTTGMLAQKWPDADVLGVDSSRRMLPRGTPEPPRFEHGDLATWRPAGPVHLVVCNAVLHWLPDPPAIVDRLLSWLAPGGVLAIQVPANFDVPSHTLVEAARREPRWADRLGSVQAGRDVDLAAIGRRLRSAGHSVDAWETTYHHGLEGADPVLRWLQGTMLRPHLAALGRRADAFLEDLAPRLREAYPADGEVTWFPFRRRFLVVRCA